MNKNGAMNNVVYWPLFDHNCLTANVPHSVGVGESPITM